MIQYLPLTLSVVGPWAFAWYSEAKREAGRIATSREDLEHRPLVWRRARIVGWWVLVTWGITIQFTPINFLRDLSLLPLFTGTAWASFTITHRLRLNLLRKMDWRFVANSSWFDRQCLRVVWIKMPTKLFNLQYHEKFKDGSGYVYKYFREDVHTAGVISYIAIALVLAISIGGAVWILN